MFQLEFAEEKAKENVKLIYQCQKKAFQIAWELGNLYQERVLKGERIKARCMAAEISNWLTQMNSYMTEYATANEDKDKSPKEAKTDEQ
jgi:hypothetical protein